jgi:hypothetical protein
LAQLKRRNTLKDGIIMIQTLLIILFIIVPIFLLLDKVTTEAEGALGSQGGGHRADQTRAGFPSPQHLWLPSQPSPAPELVRWLTIQSFTQLLVEIPRSPPLPHAGPCPWPSPAWSIRG